MLHIKEKTLQRAYSTTFRSLLNSNRFDDPEIHREDSAVIEIDSRRKNDNLRYENGALILNEKYTSLFPFIDPKIVEKEMIYWNNSLIKENKILETMEYLQTNPLSKRAIILFWNDKYRDLNGPSVCEIAVFFRKKEKRLDMNTMMRANNVSFLLYMDMDVMTGVHSLMCKALGLIPGTYMHFVNSLHFYREEIDMIKKQANFMKKSPLWNSTRTTK